jgi:hypothetical protein
MHMPLDAASHDKGFLCFSPLAEDAALAVQASASSSHNKRVRGEGVALTVVCRVLPQCLLAQRSFAQKQKAQQKRVTDKYRLISSIFHAKWCLLSYFCIHNYAHLLCTLHGFGDQMLDAHAGFTYIKILMELQPTDDRIQHRYRTEEGLFNAIICLKVGMHVVAHDW